MILVTGHKVGVLPLVGNWPGEVKVLAEGFEGGVVHSFEFTGFFHISFGVNFDFVKDGG